MTYNERERIFEEVLHDKADQFMEEMEEKYPNLQPMSLDEFLSDYRDLLTKRELERGYFILEAFSLVEYIFI